MMPSTVLGVENAQTLRDWTGSARETGGKLGEPSYFRTAPFGQQSFLRTGPRLPVVYVLSVPIDKMSIALQKRSVVRRFEVLRSLIDLRRANRYCFGLRFFMVSQEPGNGSRMNLKQSSGGGGGLVALGHHADNFLALLGRKLGVAASDSSILAGGVKSCHGSLSQHGALELREAADNLHHHPARGGGCIDGFCETPKTGVRFFDSVHQREQVSQRSRDSVQLMDDHDVIFAKLVHETLQLGSIPSSAGSFLAKDALTTSRREGDQLDVKVLLLGRNAGISNQHRITITALGGLAA